MITSGILVFIGVLLIFVKLPRKLQLKLISKPLLLDLSVAAVTLLIHWGTFRGVMAATIAGVLTSVATSVARKVLAYIAHGEADDDSVARIQSLQQPTDQS